jgi:hypothetical protein
MPSSKRSMSESYRQLVALTMRVNGLAVTGKLRFRTAAAAADAVENSDPGGHLWKLPLSVVCRSEAKPDFSGALDQANLVASAVGKIGGAVISSRAGRDVEESYCVVTLDTFIKILKQLEVPRA